MKIISNRKYEQYQDILNGNHMLYEKNLKLEQAFDLACKQLEDNDSILFDLYDRLDTYYETKDRHEWKEYLLESVEDNE